MNDLPPALHRQEQGQMQRMGFPSLNEREADQRKVVDFYSRNSFFQNFNIKNNIQFRQQIPITGNFVTNDRPLPASVDFTQSFSHQPYSEIGGVRATMYSHIPVVYCDHHATFDSSRKVGPNNSMAFSSSARFHGNNNNSNNNYQNNCGNNNNGQRHYCAHSPPKFSFSHIPPENPLPRFHPEQQHFPCGAYSTPIYDNDSFSIDTDYFDEDAMSVKVQPLPLDATKEILSNIFSQFGEVGSAVVNVGDPMYGYVNFTTPEAAMAATQVKVIIIGGLHSKIQRTTNKQSLVNLVPSSGIGLFNLPFSTTEDELVAILSAYPGFQHIKMVNRKNKAFKGYAFVYFDSKESATTAKTLLNGLVIGNHTVDVKFAKSVDGEKFVPTL